MKSGWDSASFRDLGGRIYHREGRVFRVLSGAGLSNWQAFSKNPLSARLVSDGLLIRSWEIPDSLPAVTPPGFVLEHEPIKFISYPYEWPFTLLKSAAMLHLELMEQLIPAGFILSDATASNVMFRGIRPVFIDVGSIMPYRSGDIWQGFKQFLETMLYPLFISAYKDIPHQSWLRGVGETGLPTWQVSRLFGWLDILRTGVLTHVKLADALERVAPNYLDISRDQVSSAGISSAVILRMVKRLKHTINKLQIKPKRRIWIDYDARVVYGDASHVTKRTAVLAAINLLPSPNIVWDLGCNTGEYSFLLSDKAQLIVAMDEDPAVVDELCQRCRELGTNNVLPLVMDIANPSPSQGWRSAERLSLTDRGIADLVLALGLMHHLVLTKNLPVDQLLQELARISQWCLIEQIAPDDPMAERLRRNFGPGRNELPDRNTFEMRARQHFSIEEVLPLTTTRTLYVLKTLRNDAA